MYENRVWRLFGPERQDVTEDGCNCVMGNSIICTFLDTVRLIRERRTSRVGNVACFGEMRNKKISVRNCGCKRLLEDLGLVTYLLTYLLTTWIRVLEKLSSSQLVKKLPAFYGT